MYLAELTATEKTAFLSLARHLVARDGKLQSAEQDLLQALATEMGVPVAMNEDMDYLQSVQAMETGRARRITLLELIGLAYSDGNYHVQEEQFIDDLAHAFAVNAEDLEAYEAFVQRLGVLIEEGARLIG